MYETIIVNLKGKYRRDTLEGRPHLVVPAVILKEDVITGSKGPVLYTAVENARSAPDWDHMPMVVYHPRKGGKFVRARTKEWLDSRKVGILLNTSHDDRLRTECWFDEERVRAVDNRVYQAILNERPMEVSSGLNAKLRRKTGKFNGKDYIGVAVDYKPDHLAILPDQVGALSIADGGGLFANVATITQLPERTAGVIIRSAQEALRTVGIEVANELSFSETSSQLADLLATKFGKPGKYWGGYLCDVYPDYVVFRDGDRSGDGPPTLYLVRYKVTDDEVSLVGEAETVTRAVVYKTDDGKVIGNQGTPVDTPPAPPKENDMAFDKKAHVDRLITNGQYAEKDREDLMKSPDSVLQGIEVKEKVVSPPPPPPPVVANTQLTKEQVLGLLGPDWVTTHEQGMKALKNAKAAYIERIKADPNNKFKEEVLANMDVETLAGMAEMARPESEEGDSKFQDGWEPDFTGMVGGPTGGVLANQKKGGKQKANEPPELITNKQGLQLPRVGRSVPEKVGKDEPAVADAE